MKDERATKLNEYRRLHDEAQRLLKNLTSLDTKMVVKRGVNREKLRANRLRREAINLELGR